MTNATCLGVRDQVTLVDADMTDLPFPDKNFDLVPVCLAIHNLQPTSRREDAIRVLRPGGRPAIIAIPGTKTYSSAVTQAGLRNPRRSPIADR